MALIRRKTISIKSDVVTDMLSNLNSISESVATFQKMSEQSSENDVALQYQNQRENYESQIKKLQERVQKQKKKREELKAQVSTIAAEVEQLEYERGQYKEKIVEVTQESETLEQQITKSSLKEHEIVVVSALIEEKARLAEAKAQLKKSCKEEKERLDEQLVKM